MKFVIPTQEFNFLINKCLNVVPLKPTAPILSNLLIEAVNGELILTASDLLIGIRCTTQAKVIEEGATTLPAKRLAQLVRELTSVNLEVSTNEQELTEIIADASCFKIHGMNRLEYPSLPLMENAVEINVQQSDLRDMLFRTSFAVSREDNRYVLTGVNMQIANGEAIFTGTDAKRLAKARMSLTVDAAFSGNYVIPCKAVDEILKFLKDEGEAKILLLPDRIAVETEQIRMVSKLLVGEYPDLNKIIPERSESILTLHREELMTLLRQISLFTTDNTHSVRFSFSPGEMKVNANRSDVGDEGKVSMPVNYQGEPLDIAFNPVFLLDILRHAKTETVHMGITDAYNPGIITDYEEVPKQSSARSLYVLMPMRLSHE